MAHGGVDMLLSEEINVCPFDELCVCDAQRSHQVVSLLDPRLWTLAWRQNNLQF